MAEENTTTLISQWGRLVLALLNSQWLESIAELWRLWRRLASGLAEEGMYEVLEYEATLELLDRQGEHARFQKREQVRYLQNHTIAYQDQAWADGEILLDYRCSPGVAVDQYRPDQKTYILLALREVKSRGDIDEFHIEWGMRGTFVRTTEQWETEVSHRTRRLKVQIIFPADRPPHRVVLVTGTTRRVQLLPERAQRQLPDRRWQVTWETDRPHLYERYSLKWDW
jgi:hypothetical protein